MAVRIGSERKRLRMVMMLREDWWYQGGEGGWDKKGGREVRDKIKMNLDYGI